MKLGVGYSPSERIEYESQQYSNSEQCLLRNEYTGMCSVDAHSSKPSFYSSNNRNHYSFAELFISAIVLLLAARESYVYIYNYLINKRV